MAMEMRASLPLWDPNQFIQQLDMYSSAARSLSQGYQRLQENLYEAAWLQIIGAPIPDTRIYRYLPVTLYSDLDVKQWEYLEPFSSALMSILEEGGFEIVASLSPEAGSTRKKLVVKSKNPLTKKELQRNVEIVTSAVRSNSVLRVVKDGVVTFTKVGEALNTLTSVGRTVALVVTFGIGGLLYNGGNVQPCQYTEEEILQVYTHKDKAGKTIEETKKTIRKASTCSSPPQGKKSL